MASLLDIGPLTREIDVGGNSVTVYGVTPEGFFVLLEKFPALQQLMSGSAGGLSMETLREIAPASVSWAIALATTDRAAFNTTNEWLAAVKAAAAIAVNLSVHHQIALFQAALQLTFPEGFAPFVTAMEELADSINRASGKASDTTSSKRSRTGFTTDSRGLRLGPARPSASSRH
jgi:hypothetical protein